MLNNTVNHMVNTPLATQSSLINILNKPSLSNSNDYRRVYVGKIPPGLSDHFIIRLLEVDINYKLFNLLDLWSNSKLETSNRSKWKTKGVWLLRISRGRKYVKKLKTT